MVTAAPRISLGFAFSLFIKNANRSTKIGSVVLNTEAIETLMFFIASVDNMNPPTVNTNTLSINIISSLISRNGRTHEISLFEVRPTNIMLAVPNTIL